MFGRRAAQVEEPTEAAKPEPPKHWRVRPEFILEGEPVMTDDEGAVTLDISGLPSGVTSIRLSIGGLFNIYPFDVDGHRVRHPDQTLARFYAPRP